MNGQLKGKALSCYPINDNYDRDNNSKLHIYRNLHTKHQTNDTRKKKLKDKETKSRPSIFDTGPMYTKYKIQTENLQVGDVTKPIIKYIHSVSMGIYYLREIEICVVK